VSSAQHDAAPIFLIGFMTAGKSTVGRMVAARLGWDFRDLDQVISTAAGMSVSRIFATEGEAGFRQREAQAVHEATRWVRTVVATGGGAAGEEATLCRMLAAGRVITLDVAPAEIVRRAGRGVGRPLLEGASDPLSVVIERLALREPFYARAHHRVDTNGLTAEEVAARVVELLDLSHE
jgi:shikimate kinase